MKHHEGMTNQLIVGTHGIRGAATAPIQWSWLCPGLASVASAPARSRTTTAMRIWTFTGHRDHQQSMMQISRSGC